MDSSRPADAPALQGSLFDMPVEPPAAGAPASAAEPARRILTAEQEQAAARRAGPLLLSAGAGSGKTSVLVERFVRAVREDGIAPGRILAITFTERAAGELRQRIRDRFVGLGARTAARELESAFLSTFHGFCAALLRAHPLIAGVDPDFQILEEGLAGQLRTNAFSSALDGFLAAGGDRALELLAAYGADRTQSMILDVYGELRSRGERKPSLAQPVPETSIAEALAGLERVLPDAGGEVQLALQKRSGQRLRSALDALQLAQTLLADGELEDPERLPSLARLARMELPAAVSGVLAEASCESYRVALDRYKHACADRLAVAACVLLGDLLRRFDQAYEELKRGRGALDFDDLELIARDLLRSDEQVRTSWSERFELLMVDEFQDSNPRQLEILAALERQNLCTVGDEFQSIYGFRHADVSLFRARRRELAEQDAALTLARNFRGRSELLEVTNAIFTARFGPDYTPLTAGREEPLSASPEAPLVELLLTDKNGWEQDPDNPDAGSDATTAAEIAAPTSAAPWRVAEARLLARRIAELIESGEARAADVVVLLRGLGDAGVYERELERLGLQTIAAVGGFWEHQQVEDLLAYLQALANPLDERAMYGVLASPIVGLSSDGLVLLARAARASKLGVWGVTRDTTAEIHSRLGAIDAGLLARFAERFADERETAAGREIADILRRAIDASGYEQHVLSLPGRARRLANIHKLMRIARTFQSSDGRDLRAFLDYVAHLRGSRESSEPDAPVTDEALDAVRLMSIHAAKGLEFPVVCVADMGRAGNVRAPDLLLDKHDEGHPRIGLQLVSLDGSGSIGALDFQTLRRERLNEEAAEEHRIIYVAMTRARERLLLSGAADFANWPEERPGSPPIAWVAPALLDDLPAHLRSQQAVSVLALSGTGAANVRCWLNIPPGPAATPMSVSRGSGDPREIDPRLGRPLGVSDHGAHSPAATADVLSSARTLSYTSLTQLERCGYSYYLRQVLRLPDDHTAPRSSAPRSGVQGRSRGDIVHRLLESVDFARFTAPSLAAVRQAGREYEIELSDSEAHQLAGFVEGLAGSELFARLAAAVSVAKEQPFAFAINSGEPLFTGVADVIARERDGGWLLVDYKTDHLATGEDLETLVLRDYGLQRLLYGLAALRGGAPRVSVVHWFLQRPEEYVAASFSADQTDALQRQLTDRIERMRASGFAVSDNPHRELCMTCPGRRGLCSWGEEMTLRDLAPGGEHAAVSGDDR
jgi:ATP-dependent helicase/nuclease subunit A